MYSKMESTWSREQIASGLRLAASGVPVVEVTQMMGVSLEVFSAWKTEYAELFDKLIGRFPEPKQPNNVTKTVGNRRMAYMSGSVGGEEVESELRECKIRYSVIENAAAIAGELLRSGSILGNFQKPIYWKDFPSASQPLLDGSLEQGLPRTRSEFSDSNCERIYEKKVRETDGSQMGQAGEGLFILVSAQLVNQERGSPQSGASRGEAALSGVFSSEIDELRWRADLASGSQIDEAIIRDVAVKFSLDGILDAPIDAIRAFYTSPMDALLLGNFLMKKSDSPSRRA